jgi:uncharacterized circularly permuted ATP-grasp superfamily protein/uncharacterized alpha-E superfamily protein
MTPRDLEQRRQIGQRLVQTNGVTYNVYGDPRGKERPWALDPIPLVLSTSEWQQIESAVVQRATLHNAILSDLYGGQRLIKERHLPAALLFANPHFLRPCHGIVPPGGIYLHHYAADMARSPDGRWWVLTDRAQAPFGVGYALENRLVSARMLPEVFNKSHVRPLNRFFAAQRDSLLALAPNSRTNPRAVLLTPGPHNETYFEHSFLARHWGFPLVEGADLTVRDNRVFLKTLTGLEQVDLILRRLDDSFCDPLELRGDSLLGVPGLTQAARRGHVAIANALGSGLVESAALMAFLPGLCRLLLGEELHQPSVATWWCGQPEPRAFVTANLKDVVIKPAFPAPGRAPLFPASMDQEARRQLLHLIEARPDQYVAQEQVTLSTAPVYAGHSLAPRHVVIRVFAAWDGNSYTVMPGALARVSTEATSMVVSMQQGGGSKDTWVTARADEPESTAPSHEHPVRQTATALPSRVVDNLFWLGRYAERVESGVRLVRALIPSLSGEEDFGSTVSLDTAVDLLAGLGHVESELQSVSLAQKRWIIERLLADLVFDANRGDGVAWNLKHLRRIAWPLKERLSQDTWRVLQQIERDLSGTRLIDSKRRIAAGMDLLDGAIVNLAALSGLWTENTTRGQGWHFLDTGRRMERALQLIELLRAAIGMARPGEEPPLETLIQIADSSITYRTRYFTALRVDFVLEMLLQDASNPRSVRFQLERLEVRLRALMVQDDLSRRAAALVREANMHELAARNTAGDFAALTELMGQLREMLYDLSEALTGRYFIHLTASRLPDTF